ncbi:hypothetical protein LRP30_07520 [Bradyrhizobium sp. C-145]|uniref:hypothetical protein n=1 Tax=Bradyrhizobium sp. C-145 TaxID=574727 RepID=UPI00201B8730|nr:hypothetical protein [Bradyrhizobium sp. C-145]UQR65095.1 hypothetical protein LRP30_07520 [Bradyrhizobium sp. C-145]
MSAQIGTNYLIEIIAESLLQCVVTSLTTPPPVTPPGGPFTNFDPSTAANVTLSGSNLVATNTGTTSTDQGAMVVSSAGKTIGKYYFEFALTHFAGGSGVGVGIGTTSSAFSGMGTSSAHGDMCCAVSRNLWTDLGGNTGYNVGRGLVSGDVIGVAADITNSRVWFRLNSGLWENMVGHDPTQPDGLHGGIPIPAGTKVPFVTFGSGLFGGGVANNVITANIGGSSFRGVVPTGYTAGWPQ